MRAGFRPPTYSLARIGPQFHNYFLRLDGKELKTFRYEGERRLRLISDYAHSKECRSVFIRRYFGEDYPPRCGTCDRCRAERVVAEPAGPAPISRPKSRPRAQDRHQPRAKNARRRRQGARS